MHCHYYIKSGLRCFLGSTFLIDFPNTSISNITSQNAGRNLNNKANAAIPDTETSRLQESEGNKAKLDS